MKQNARKLTALILVLAMLLSTFGMALAEDIMPELGMDQPIEIEGEVGADGDTQAPEGELEIDMDEAEGLPDGDVDPEGGEELDLSLDLDGESLETFEEALAPETEAAMNAGETWTPFNEQNPPTSAGNYEIPDGGLSLPHSWTVPTNGVTKLKLSGLLNLGSSYYIQVNDGATLEIFSDSNKSILGSNYYLIRLNGGALKLHGGTIEGENTTQPVTGVYVVSGTFTMDSGEISVKAEGGAGVINQGTFTMEKGKITAEGDGAEGVINSTGNTSGTFEMHGDAGTCTISAKGLGAAGVDNEAGCTFIMKGGSVAATGDNSQSVNNNGMFTMGAGSEISGEFVGISNGNGTFTMNGGEISMPDDATIAVENSSTFNMTGGTISANDKQATGVKNQGTFNMTGGTISGFDNGVSNFTGGTFTMDKDTSGSSTGTISGNNWGVNNNSAFTMKDGRINGNTEYGVYVSSGTFEMSGGAITGNKQYGVKQNAYNATIQLSGKVDISGNTTADVNLFYSSGVITVGENFSCDKPIGVYVDNDNESLRGRVITRNFKKNTGAKDPSKFFVSKNEGLGLFWNKDKTEAMFDKSVTITFDANGGEGTMEPWTAPYGNLRGALVPECEFTRRGHTFYAWMLKATDGNEIIPAGSDTFFDDDDDTVLYAVWK